MNKKNIKKGFLSAREYQNILGSVPVVCVDLIVKCGDEVLLVKRNHKPAKGKLWIPGGRILKGETFKKAILRKLQEDAGISKRLVTCITPLPAGETFFKTSEFGVPTHTINITFLVTVSKKKNQKSGLDGDIFWFKNIPSSVSPYVRKYVLFATSFNK